MTNKIAGLIVQARWFILAAFAALLAVAAVFITQFKIDASADTLLVKDNELYIKTQVANQVFSPEEFILLAYKPTKHELFSEQTFTDIKQLSADIKKIPRVKAVTSIISVPLISNPSALSGGTDVASLTWEQQHYSPNTMKDLVSDHPIFTDLLINRQNTATSIQVVFEQDPKLVNIQKSITNIEKLRLKGELTQAQQAELESLKAQADPIKQRLTQIRKKEIAQLEAITQQVEDRASTYLGGSYVVGQHLIDIIQSDLVIFGSAIGVVITLLLAVLYRSIRWVVFPLMSCVVSVVLTMGLFGMLDMRTTVISANFVALQLILTLAVMIHLIGSYREIARDDNSLKQHKRIQRMLADKLAPCFYATVTTSVGFGSLVFSGLQPVVAFGWMMLIAMLVTMAVSLLLFPAMLSFLSASKESDDFTFLTQFLNRARSLSVARPKMLSLSVVLLFGIAALGISRLDVENSFIDYFAKDTQVHKELAFIDQEFGGTTALDIIVDIPPQEQKNDLVMTAQSLNKLQLVQKAVEAFEATGSVTSVVNFTLLGKQVNDGAPLTEYELTSIYHLLDEQIVQQLVGGYFSEESQQMRMAVRIQDTTPNLDRETFLKQLNQDIQGLGIKPEHYQLTSLFVLYQDILARLFDSQIVTLGIVYVVLGIALFIIFRSVPVALIALVPNILTTLAILGVIGWLGIPLDIMTITIAAIAMGIAVDDTIHFLHRYLAALKSASGKDNAYQASTEAFHHSGLAIIITSTVITVGFSLFGFSDFLPSVYFGLLTATAMLMALLSDLTILPALLNWFVAGSSTQGDGGKEEKING